MGVFHVFKILQMVPNRAISHLGAIVSKITPSFKIIQKILAIHFSVHERSVHSGVNVCSFFYMIVVQKSKQSIKNIPDTSKLKCPYEE